MTACPASNTTSNGRRSGLPNGVLWQRWARYALADLAQVTTPALALPAAAGVVLIFSPCPSPTPPQSPTRPFGPQGGACGHLLALGALTVAFTFEILNPRRRIDFVVPAA